MMRTAEIAPTGRTALRLEPEHQAAGSVETPDRAAVEGIAAALEQRFGSALTPLIRCEIAQEAIDHYRDAPVQVFVTILAQRLAIVIAARRLGLGSSISGDLAEGPIGREEQ